MSEIMHIKITFKMVFSYSHLIEIDQEYVVILPATLNLYKKVVLLLK